MSRRSSVAGILGAGIFVVSAAGGALASSHREAPLISKDPSADNTDTYAWIPPTKQTSHRPGGQLDPVRRVPKAAPNYWEWNDEYTYQIHVDNDGDAVADITYELTSRTEVAQPEHVPVQHRADQTRSSPRQLEPQAVRDGQRARRRRRHDDPHQRPADDAEQYRREVHPELHGARDAPRSRPIGDRCQRDQGLTPARPTTPSSSISRSSTC